jgi:hypothetical protein
VPLSFIRRLLILNQSCCKSRLHWTVSNSYLLTLQTRLILIGIFWLSYIVPVATSTMNDSRMQLRLTTCYRLSSCLQVWAISIVCEPFGGPYNQEHPRTRDLLWRRRGGRGLKISDNNLHFLGLRGWIKKPEIHLNVQAILGDRNRGSFVTPQVHEGLKP